MFGESRTHSGFESPIRSGIILCMFPRMYDEHTQRACRLGLFVEEGVVGERVIEAEGFG